MADALKIEVVLAVAGPTAWDLSGRLAGRTDLPLAAEGVAAAHKAAEAAGVIGPGSLLCGTDEASTAAAALIGKSCRLKPRILGGLAPLDLGLWEGLTKVQLLERCPKVCRTLQTDPASILPPNGESWTDFRNRVMSALFGAVPRKAGSPMMLVVRPSTMAVIQMTIDELSGRPAAEIDCTAKPDWGAVKRLTIEPTPALAGTERGGWMGFAAMGLGMMGLAAGGPWPTKG